MTRRQIFVVLGLLMVVGSIMLAKYLGSLKDDPNKSVVNTTSRLVRASVVNNADLSPETSFLGSVKAREKVELFAEVNGISVGTYDFREGNRFRKGDVLVKMDDEELRMTLLAQKTSFLNQIANALPDIQLDFKESFGKWEDYVNSFDENKPLRELPVPASSKEKLFVASKNLSNLFYTIKSQEARIEKFVLIAPFDGIVSVGMLNKGSLVRAGQKLGELLSSSDYEVEGAIRSKDIGFVSVSDSVHFKSSDGSDTWVGNISRVSDFIDPGTQTVNVYAIIQGDNLRDGMYLNGTIFSEKMEDCITIDRRLLLADTAVYAAADSVLISIPVQVLKLSESQALVRGIPDGSRILTEPINNAHPGMRVTVEQ